MYISNGQGDITHSRAVKYLRFRAINCGVNRQQYFSVCPSVRSFAKPHNVDLCVTSCEHTRLVQSVYLMLNFIPWVWNRLGTQTKWPLYLTCKILVFLCFCFCFIDWLFAWLPERLVSLNVPHKSLTNIANVQVISHFFNDTDLLPVLCI